MILISNFICDLYIKMSEAKEITLGNWPSLRNELFTRELFEEKELSQEYKNAKTHQMVKCLNCL